MVQQRIFINKDFESIVDSFDALKYSSFPGWEISLKKKEVEWWNSAKTTIRGMSIKNQSKYADYVTRKMCELDNKTIIEFGNMVVNSLERCGVTKNSNVCSIGNVALVIMSLPDGQDKTKLTYFISNM